MKLVTEVRLENQIGNFRQSVCTRNEVINDKNSAIDSLRREIQTLRQYAADKQQTINEQSARIADLQNSLNYRSTYYPRFPY